ncbi:hypothetical protein [Agromyces badenianii]|uniref:hypothetical protein n=1 Tax=Agromyces badenianii TaxID=2080742 RepID=UPI0011B1EE56|nr:hypothetical protein [Agromyces badenianii]
MSGNGTAFSDADLLQLASDVLLEAGFALETIDGEPRLVLAENQYFLVAIAATPTIEQLLVAESLTESVLAHRLSESDVGAKVWDVYVVLLTQERSLESESSARALYQINYDTSRVRRIARDAVPPTIDGVRAALAPFVAPREITEPSVTADPLALLRVELQSSGVSADLSSRAVAAFEQGASLADIL